MLDNDGKMRVVEPTVQAPTYHSDFNNSPVLGEQPTSGPVRLYFPLPSVYYRPPSDEQSYGATRWRKPNGVLQRVHGAHHGCDFGSCGGHAVDGQPIHAPASGRVIDVDPDPKDARRDPKGAGGYSVTILHDDGVTKTVYRHVKPDIPVRKDDRVQTGDVIARVGNTGLSAAGGRYASHLHMEVYRKNANGQWEHVDPFPLLERTSAAEMRGRGDVQEAVYRRPAAGNGQRENGGVGGIDLLIEATKKHEGFVPHPYADPPGSVARSVGYGFQLKMKNGEINEENRAIWAKSGIGKDFNAVLHGSQTLTQDEAEALTRAYYNYHAIPAVKQYIPNFDKLPAQAQAAVLDTAYQCGPHCFSDKYRTFVRFREAIKDGDYAEAGHEMNRVWGKYKSRATWRAGMLADAARSPDFLPNGGAKYEVAEAGREQAPAVQNTPGWDISPDSIRRPIG